MELCNIVNNAVRDWGMYPDYYNGVSYRHDSFYPDHYIGAGLRENSFHPGIKITAGQKENVLYPDARTLSASLHHKSVVQNYRDAAQMRSFPRAFTATSEIEARSSSPCSTKENIPPPRLTGANLEPLPSRSLKKRGTNEDFLDDGSRPKKIKAETRSVIDLTKDQSAAATNRIIDLTDNDSTNVILPLRPRLQQVTQLPRRKKKPADQPEPQTPIQQRTEAEFQTVLVRLKQNEANMNKNRDVLRKRWEADTDLRRQSVTDDLKQLNGFFKREEDAILDAITLMESRFGRSTSTT